jgi:hypothetical protein
MAKVKSFISAAGQFILGLVGWMLIGSLLNMSVVIKFHMSNSDIMFYVGLIVTQLVGLGLAFLTFRFKMRSIGVGILWGFGLFLLGSVLRGCVPPLLLPFPLTALGWC